MKYKISQIDSKVLLSVTDGTITQDGNLVSIRNKAGKAVWAMPLTHSLENKQFPIELVIQPNRVARARSRISRATPADAKQVAYSRKVTQDYASNGYRSRRTRRRRAAPLQLRGPAGITITSIIFAVIGVIIGVALIGTIGCAIIVACVPALGRRDPRRYRRHHHRWRRLGDCRGHPVLPDRYRAVQPALPEELIVRVP